MDILIQALILIGGLILILLGANYLVDGSSSIAKKFGLSEFVIGLTIVGIGTSSPEMVVSFMSAIQGKAEMAIGNVVGSNIFNITLILGACAQITPLTSSGITPLDYLVAIGAAVIIFILGFTKKINRIAGLMMIGAFIAYTIYLLK